MSFTLPQYHAPDFDQPLFRNAPNVTFSPAPRAGVAPEGYHATSIFPEYFKVNGAWLLAEESRMDCVAVLREGKIAVVEFRNLKEGEPVVVGRTEDASQGIYIHADGFESDKGEQETFSFRQGRSRETAYSMDYDSIYELLRHEKDHGRILWVMGPACAFDHDARDAFAALVRGGYVHGLLAGNALATHDLEAGYLRTALGQDIYTQKSMPNGHYNHIDTLNAVRLAGSTAAFVHSGKVKDGIIYECVNHDVPFVLVGSVRRHHRDLHGLHPPYGGHRQHDPLLPGGGRSGAPGVFLLGGYLRVRGEQAAGPGQPVGAHHCHQCAGFCGQRPQRRAVTGRKVTSFGFCDPKEVIFCGAAEKYFGD